MRVYPNYYKKAHNYIKNFSLIEYKKKFCLVNIRMINLSFDKLRLIAQIRNISDYKNKSKEDLIKALSEPEAKPQTPKPQLPKPQTPKPKPQTPNQETKPKLEPEPKIEVKRNEKRLGKIRKDFDELRHKFSKKEIKEYRKAFYVAKNKKYLSKSEITKTNKNLNPISKVLDLKKFVVILTASIMKTLIIMIIIMILLMMTNIEKLEALEHYLKSFIVIITNQ